MRTGRETVAPPGNGIVPSRRQAARCSFMLLVTACQHIIHTCPGNTHLALSLAAEEVGQLGPFLLHHGAVQNRGYGTA